MRGMMMATVNLREREIAAAIDADHIPARCWKQAARTMQLHGMGSELELLARGEYASIIAVCEKAKSKQIVTEENIDTFLRCQLNPDVSREEARALLEETARAIAEREVFRKIQNSEQFTMANAMKDFVTNRESAPQTVASGAWTDVQDALSEIHLRLECIRGNLANHLNAQSQVVTDKWRAIWTAGFNVLAAWESHNVEDIGMRVEELRSSLNEIDDPDWVKP